MVWFVALLAILATAILSLIGLAWLILWMMPYYLIVGIILFLIFRSKQRRDHIAQSLADEAERRRRLNDQEFKAWQTSVDEARHHEMSRAAKLQRINKLRDGGNSNTDRFPE